MENCIILKLKNEFTFWKKNHFVNVETNHKLQYQFKDVCIFIQYLMFLFLNLFMNLLFLKNIWPFPPIENDDEKN